MSEGDTPTHSHSHEHHSYESTIKKKTIKKQRQSGKAQPGNKLTKEERMKIQKEKNREAAQRSRDQHKEYVNNLENQLRLLKEELQLSKKYCYSCKRKLDQQDRFFDQALENELSLEEDGIFHREEHIEVQEPMQKEQEIDAPREQDYYLRIKNEEEDFNYLKMMLFIAMIAIGLFLYPSSSTSHDANRNLLELYQAPISKPILMDEFTIDSSDTPRISANDTPQGHTHPPQMFVDLNSGLVVRNSVINEQCLDSLIQDQPFSLTNLRTSHPSISSQMGEGVLLCSFEHHKARPAPTAGEKSAFLRLFLMGAEIKEMVTANSPIKKFIESNLQLNGIYRIAAEVKQVELISTHNCLL